MFHRVLRPSGKLVLLTSAKLMDFLIECMTGNWPCEEDSGVKQTEARTKELPPVDPDVSAISYIETKSICRKQSLNTATRFSFEAEHYLRLGETDSYACVFNKCGAST